MAGDMAVGSPVISPLGRPGCGQARGPVSVKTRPPLIVGDAVDVSDCIHGHWIDFPVL